MYHLFLEARQHPINFILQLYEIGKRNSCNSYDLRM